MKIVKTNFFIFYVFNPHFFMPHCFLIGLKTFNWPRPIFLGRHLIGLDSSSWSNLRLDTNFCLIFLKVLVSWIWQGRGSWCINPAYGIEFYNVSILFADAEPILLGLFHYRLSNHSFLFSRPVSSHPTRLIQNI